MASPDAENGELLKGHIMALSRGSQLRVRLEDGREIRAIPLIEALEQAECREAPIFNRPVQVRMYKHPRLPRDRTSCAINLAYVCASHYPWHAESA